MFSEVHHQEPASTKSQRNPSSVAQDALADKGDADDFRHKLNRLQEIMLSEIEAGIATTNSQGEKTEEMISMEVKTGAATTKSCFDCKPKSCFDCKPKSCFDCKSKEDWRWWGKRAAYICLAVSAAGFVMAFSGIFLGTPGPTGQNVGWFLLIVPGVFGLYGVSFSTA